MNMTPWPTNTSSSIVTPSQMNVCEEILHRAPIVAFFWISTKAPTLVSSPMLHPYRLTRSGWTISTFWPSATLEVIGIASRSSGPARGLHCAHTITDGITTSLACPFTSQPSPQRPVGLSRVWWGDVRHATEVCTLSEVRDQSHEDRPEHSWHRRLPVVRQFRLGSRRRRTGQRKRKRER